MEGRAEREAQRRRHQPDEGSFGTAAIFWLDDNGLINAFAEVSRKELERLAKKKGLSASPLQLQFHHLDVRHLDDGWERITEAAKRVGVEKLLAERHLVLPIDDNYIAPSLMA